MYKRTGNKFPEYTIIVTDKEDVKINLDNLNEGSCLTNIQTAIDNYVTIKDYIDFVFERGIKGVELEIIEDEEIKEDGKEDVEPKKKIMKLKAKKIKPTLVLEEEDGLEEEQRGVRGFPVIEDLKDLKEDNDVKPVIKETIINPVDEEIEIIPVKKRKTKRQREQKLIVNPAGKKTTRRKLPENIEIVGDVELVI
jgi:hypothetical protein